ncbi:hypothetical protein QV65_24050, partial [Rhodococcus erythropolis]
MAQFTQHLGDLRTQIVAQPPTKFRNEHECTENSERDATRQIQNSGSRDEVREVRIASGDDREEDQQADVGDHLNRLLKRDCGRCTDGSEPALLQEPHTQGEPA